MNAMDLLSLIPTIAGAAIGGVACYIAIRVDLAVLKVQAEHNREIANAAHTLASDAHDRLNRLRNMFTSTKS